MAFVSIDEQKLWDGLNGLLDIDEFKEKVGNLKGMPFGVDFISVIADIFVAAITKVEEIAGQGMGKEKRNAVVKFLDDIIKFPFYLEFLDGPIIGAIVDLLVAWIFPKK